MTGQVGNRELRIAIVGCGALTELFYVPALTCLSSQRLAVAALIDPDPARLAAISVHFPGARCGRGLGEIPDGTDLAIVASPAGFHAGQTIELLDRGMHVLCEKPMAPSAAECDAMIEAARRADRVLAIGHFKRFFPATRQIKELVETKALGPVLGFRFFDGGKFGWPAQSRTLFERKGGGGGALIDVGIHVLDLTLWWFGEPAKIACADDAMGGVEANCRVTLSYAGDVTGKIIVSRDWDLPNRFFIRFERGWICWNPIDANHVELGWGERYALKATTHAIASSLRVPAAGREAESRHQAFMRQIVNVLDAIRGAGRPGVTGEDGRRAVALIETCYAKSTLIDMPWMSEAERKRGRELRCLQ